MLFYFFVLRAKFYKALKHNNLTKFYRSNCLIRVSVVLFTLFYWLHCNLSVLDGIFAINDLVHIINRENHIAIYYLNLWKAMQPFTLIWQIISFLTEVLCFIFFYLYVVNVVKLKKYFNHNFIKRKKAWFNQMNAFGIRMHKSDSIVLNSNILDEKLELGNQI